MSHPIFNQHTTQQVHDENRNPNQKSLLQEIPDQSYHEEVKSPNLGDAVGENDKEVVGNLPEEATGQLSPEEHNMQKFSSDQFFLKDNQYHPKIRSKEERIQMDVDKMRRQSNMSADLLCKYDQQEKCRGNAAKIQNPEEIAPDQINQACNESPNEFQLQNSMPHKLPTKSENLNRLQKNKLRNVTFKKSNQDRDDSVEEDSLKCNEQYDEPVDLSSKKYDGAHKIEIKAQAVKEDIPDKKLPPQQRQPGRDFESPFLKYAQNKIWPQPIASNQIPKSMSRVNNHVSQNFSIFNSMRENDKNGIASSLKSPICDYRFGNLGQLHLNMDKIADTTNKSNLKSDQKSSNGEITLSNQKGVNLFQKQFSFQNVSPIDQSQENYHHVRMFTNLSSNKKENDNEIISAKQSCLKNSPMIPRKLRFSQEPTIPKPTQSKVLINHLNIGLKPPEQSKNCKQAQMFTEALIQNQTDEQVISQQKIAGEDRVNAKKGLEDANINMEAAQKIEQANDPACPCGPVTVRTPSKGRVVTPQQSPQPDQRHKQNSHIKSILLKSSQKESQTGSNEMGKFSSQQSNLINHYQTKTNGGSILSTNFKINQNSLLKRGNESNKIKNSDNVSKLNFRKLEYDKESNSASQSQNYIAIASNAAKKSIQSNQVQSNIDLHQDHSNILNPNHLATIRNQAQFGKLYQETQQKHGVSKMNNSQRYNKCPAMPPYMGQQIMQYNHIASTTSALYDSLRAHPVSFPSMNDLCGIHNPGQLHHPFSSSSPAFANQNISHHNHSTSHHKHSKANKKMSKSKKKPDRILIVNSSTKNEILQSGESQQYHQHNESSSIKHILPNMLKIGSNIKQKTEIKIETFSPRPNNFSPFKKSQLNNSFFERTSISPEQVRKLSNACFGTKKSKCATNEKNKIIQSSEKRSDNFKDSPFIIRSRPNFYVKNLDFKNIVDSSDSRKMEMSASSEDSGSGSGGSSSSSGEGQAAESSSSSNNKDMDQQERQYQILYENGLFKQIVPPHINMHQNQFSHLYPPSLQEFNQIMMPDYQMVLNNLMNQGYTSQGFHGVGGLQHTPGCQFRCTCGLMEHWQKIRKASYEQTIKGMGGSSQVKQSKSQIKKNSSNIKSSKSSYSQSNEERYDPNQRISIMNNPQINITQQNIFTGGNQATPVVSNPTQVCQPQFGTNDFFQNHTSFPQQMQPSAHDNANNDLRQNNENNNNNKIIIDANESPAVENKKKINKKSNQQAFSSKKRSKQQQQKVNDPDQTATQIKVNDKVKSPEIEANMNQVAQEDKIDCKIEKQNKRTLKQSSKKSSKQKAKKDSIQKSLQKESELICDDDWQQIYQNTALNPTEGSQIDPNKLINTVSQDNIQNSKEHKNEEDPKNTPQKITQIESLKLGAQISFGAVFEAAATIGTMAQSSQKIKTKKKSSEKNLDSSIKDNIFKTPSAYDEKQMNLFSTNQKNNEVNMTNQNQDFKKYSSIIDSQNIIVSKTSHKPQKQSGTKRQVSNSIRLSVKEKEQELILYEKKIKDKTKEIQAQTIPQEELFKKKQQNPDMVGCTGCKCQNSMCLKLYCDCLRNKATCGPECQCNKDNCNNKSDYWGQREKAIQEILKRNINAFEKKISVDKNQHFKGCNCKNSKCQKKYCECYERGVPCVEGKCKCQDCGNGKQPCQAHQDQDEEEQNETAEKKQAAATVPSTAVAIATIREEPFQENEFQQRQFKPDSSSMHSENVSMCISHDHNEVQDMVNDNASQKYSSKKQISQQEQEEHESQEIQFMDIIAEQDEQSRNEEEDDDMNEEKPFNPNETLNDQEMASDGSQGSEHSSQSNSENDSNSRSDQLNEEDPQNYEDEEQLNIEEDRSEISDADSEPCSQSTGERKRHAEPQEMEENEGSLKIGFIEEDAVQKKQEKFPGTKTIIKPKKIEIQNKKDLTDDDQLLNDAKQSSLAIGKKTPSTIPAAALVAHNPKRKTKSPQKMQTRQSKRLQQINENKQRPKQSEQQRSKQSKQ